MLAIIQARTSSKRFKGKVLKKINKKFLLERVINKVSQSNRISRIIVATSIEKTDDKIVNFCKKQKIEFFRGSLNNVYERFFNLLKNTKAKSFIRICADSPFIDSYLIDKCINFYNRNKYGIVTNVSPRSFPKGQSIEIFNSKIFMKHASKIKKKRHQEHVTKYFYENSKKFEIKNFEYIKDYSKLNLSVDNQKDIKLAKKIAKKFDNYKGRKNLLDKMVNYSMKI